LPAGVAQQLWLAFYPRAGFEPGEYRGALVIEPEHGDRLRVPLTLTVEPPVYPDEHTLALGMWDYTDRKGYVGLHAGNLAAAVAHMQSYGYNVPWASPGVLSRPGAEDFDADDKLTRQLDFSGLDAWVKMWPKAKYYAVFAHGPDNMAGAAAGTEQFNRRVGAWMRPAADHLRSMGVDLRRFLLLLVDEPGGGETDRLQLLWSRAVKASVPEFLIFTDPTHKAPHREGLKEMFEAADIICPYRTSYENGGQEVRDFYEELRAGGRQLWLYAIGAGPSRDYIAGARAQKWMVWAMQGAGSHFWSYGDVGRGGSRAGSWNTLAPTKALYTPVYLDADSVTDSKAWLAIIEGLQDYEYLRMLRDRVAETGKAGRQSPALERARTLLETLPNEIIRAAKAGDRASTDRGRLQVLDALMALQ